MTSKKYKVILEEVAGDTSYSKIIETDDVDLVREICDLPIRKVEVNTPNESIDHDWQTILEQLNKKDAPVTPYITPNWWEGIQEQQRKFKPPYEITC